MAEAVVHPDRLPAGAQMVLDALASHSALVDASGQILTTNRSWKRFALENGGAGMVDAGVNYFDVCMRTRPGPDHSEAMQAEAGIRAVLAGRSDLFELEYPCHASGEERWFVMRVTPLELGDRRLALVTHTNVTRMRAERDRLEQARESTSFERMSHSGRHVAKMAMGLRSLRESDSERFEDMAREYAEALRLAVHRRMGDRGAQGAPEFKRLAEEMVEMRLGPRDVVDVHLRGMHSCIEGLSISQAQLFAEEGRLALLELMGDLVAAYRRTSVAVTATESRRI